MNLFIPFIFKAMFIIIPILILCTFIYVFYFIISENIKNKSYPIIVESVTVKDKRNNYSNNMSSDTSGSNTYHITFEFENSSERLEFRISSREFGLISVGDRGELTYQGTRYISFNRNIL